MENFEIITDSSANLQKALLDIYHIHILTLRFSRDKKEYRSYEEGVDRALDEVYESLRKKEKIETFCVEEKEAYDKIYELTKQGKDVLYIGMSSAMSNTYENVEIFEDTKRLCEKIEKLKTSIAESVKNQ